jgi:hypothetical protein
MCQQKNVPPLVKAKRLEKRESGVNNFDLIIIIIAEVERI